MVVRCQAQPQVVIEAPAQRRVEAADGLVCPSTNEGRWLADEVAGANQPPGVEWLHMCAAAQRLACDVDELGVAIDYRHVGVGCKNGDCLSNSAWAVAVVGVQPREDASRPTRKPLR